MHTKAVFQGVERARPHRLRGAALQLPRRGHERTARSTTAAARSTTSGGARLPDRRAIRPCRCGPPAFRSARGSRSRPASADPRVGALIGIAPPLTRGYTFARTTRVARSRSSSSRATSTSSARSRTSGRSTRSCKEPKEIVIIDGAIASLRGQDGRGGRSARRAAGRFRIMTDAVIVSAVRTPSAKRRTARCDTPGPTSWRRSCSAKRSRACRRSMPPRSTTS